MAEERAKLRAIFDEAALVYDEVRPGERLFRGIADLTDQQNGGSITKGYLTTLYVARRV
jgi:hypothetical protein